MRKRCKIVTRKPEKPRGLEGAGKLQAVSGCEYRVESRVNFASNRNNFIIKFCNDGNCSLLKLLGVSGTPELQGGCQSLVSQCCALGPPGLPVCWSPAWALPSTCVSGPLMVPPGASVSLQAHAYSPQLLFLLSLSKL